MNTRLQDCIEIDIDDVVVYIKDKNGENSSLLNKEYGDLAKDDYLFVISNVKEIQDGLMELMDTSIKPKHHGAKWSAIANIIRNMTDDSILIVALQDFYGQNLMRNGEYFFVTRPYLKDCMKLHSLKKNTDISKSYAEKGLHSNV